jgi:uncharacterized RDD family membrane protein YckC
MLKCEKCGNELAGGSVICQQCGFNNALQRLGGWRASRGRIAQAGATRRSQDASLIPFPVPGNKPPPPEKPADQAAFPPWRDQLNEKLRQIRQRRSGESQQQVAPPAPEKNPLVEAAIRRLQRATPATSTWRATGGGAQTTARVMEMAASFAPEASTEVQTALAKEPLKTSGPDEASRPERDSRLNDRSGTDPAGKYHRAPLEPPEAESLSSQPPLEEPAISLRVAPLIARAAAWMVDLEIIAFSFLPFFTVFAFFNSDLGQSQSPPLSLYVLGGIAVVLVFVYHFVTVALAGRTCGLAIFNLHIVDAARTRPTPNLAQAAGRALGAVGSLLIPLNLLIILLSPQRQSLSDHLSGTMIVRE